ncbi:MAG: hypothetical protein CL933_16910 [Deltaproteobacteria bacterium]|nr:hypothetical protein [Deltaproteobacteria bacterium]
MSDPSTRALEVFSGHLRRIEEGGESDLEALCADHQELADELRQLHQEWSRMSDVLERLGPKQGTLSLELRQRYGDSVDPEISLSAPDEGGEFDESSAALMSKLSSQGGSERYRARDEIARGGMGAILKVWDEDLRRPLAMKVALRDDGGTTGAASDANSQKRLSRFLEEAQITSQLDHPGIVPVHDLGIDAEGRVYFTMQLVDGRDMRDIVALAQREEEGWDLKRIVGVLVRVCEALAYAHAKDVVHRDVKPGNVMVGKFGEVFLMDWGLAKVLGREEELDAATSTIIHTLRSDGSSAEHTIAGDVVGTPAFMAPEQALGRGDEVGPASDIYAVGAMLYLILTGQIPYQPLGESVSALTILEAVKAGPPWPVKKINPDAPPELIAICEKAMAREVSDRFSEAMALGEELRNWLEGHAVATYETGLFYGIKKWVGRNKAMAGTLLGMVFLVIGGLGLLFQQQQESIQDLQSEQELTKAAQEAAEKNAAQAQEEAERAKDAEQRAKTQSARAFSEQAKVASLENQRLLDLEENRRARYRAQVTAAWFSLRLTEANRTRMRLAATDKDLRGWEWRHLDMGTEDTVVQPLAHPNGSMDLAIFGEVVVSMGSDAVARIFDAGDWSHKDHPVRYGLPTIGASGFSGIGAQVNSGRNACTLSSQGVLATASQSSVVLLWNLETLKVIGSLIGGGGQLSGTSAVVSDLAFSPDGEHLATVDVNGVVRIWTVPEGELVWEGEVTDPLACVAFHPQKEQVAFGTTNGRVEIWNYVEGARLGGFVDDRHSVINALSYSHDGATLASAQEDGEVQLWDTEQLVGQARGEGEGFSLKGISAAKLLIDVLEWAKHKPKYRLKGHRLGATCLVFSWDDRFVYAGGRDGSIRAWSAVHGASSGVMHGHQASVHGLSMLSGERLISGAEDGTLRIFDPYWEETRQAVGVSAESPVLFVGEKSDVNTGGEVVTVGLGANGSIVNEIVTVGDGRGMLKPDADAWVAGVMLGDLFLALASGGADVFVVDAQTSQLVKTLKRHDAKVVDLASDEMGYKLITGSSDSRAIVWEGLDEGEDLESWDISHGRGVVAVAITPDGAAVVTADKDRDIQLWDAELRKETQRWESAHKWQIQDLAISLDGAMVASASKENVNVYRVGEEGGVSTLGPHQADVSAVYFHSDGQRLFTGDVVGNIYLWDINGADVLLELVSHEAAITSLSLSADGASLLSGDAEGQVYAWRSERHGPRYERWKLGPRRALREERVMRYFDGDEELVYQRLNEGVPGLAKGDPVVAHLLEVLAPAKGAPARPDDE